MRKDIARAQRGEHPLLIQITGLMKAERPVPISKPEVQRLPITSWLATADRAITLEKNEYVLRQ